MASYALIDCLQEGCDEDYDEDYDKDYDKDYDEDHDYERVAARWQHVRRPPSAVRRTADGLRPKAAL